MAPRPTSDTPCPHCHAPAVRDHRRWGPLLLGAAYLYASATVVLGSLLGPAVLAVLPWIIFGGIGTVTAAHQLATREPECQACGKIARPASVVEPTQPRELRHAA